MSIERLSTASLEKLFKNQVKESATCVIKFYSNECHFCHALKDEYEATANKFDDVLFFAYNIDDEPSIDHIVKINGVPTVSMVKTGLRQKISFLSDPEAPHEEMWYHPGTIASFIEKEK